MSKKGGNYPGRKPNPDWVLDPTVTAFTSRPTFDGKPCKRCGSTVRFDAKVRQCVRCLKQWRKENRHKWERKPVRRVWKNPVHAMVGITPETFEIFLTMQGGVCGICRTKPDKRLVVDHCHETGRYRGLLCQQCNSGLGFFRDDPLRLQSAIDYLKSNPWSL